MQRAYTLAEEASSRGDGPFGALIVRRGEVVVEARNGTRTAGDATRHAERYAIEKASARCTREQFAQCTLYTSTEPCIMCAGAIHQAGIGRVVYGVPALTYLSIAGRPVELLPIRELAERCNWEMDIVGPVMQDDGILIHQEHWRAHRDD